MQYGLKIRSHAVIVDFRLTKKITCKSILSSLRYVCAGQYSSGRKKSYN